MRGFLLVLAAWVWFSSVASYTPPAASQSASTIRPGLLQEIERQMSWRTLPPLMRAILDVESSGGRDCGIGAGGELTCWQIKPATAEWVGCADRWHSDSDGPYSHDCALRVLAKARELCRRVDTAGLAKFYGVGRCLGQREKPPPYAMRVLAALPKHLMARHLAVARR